MKNFDIYQMVTNLIVERLESGVVPWQMPWKAGGMPRNGISRRPYSGFNFWYLLSFRFERPWFLTFNQVKELGGSIKKGSKSFLVVFWKLLDVTRDDGTMDEVPMLRYYRVFHIDQVTGIPAEKLPKLENHDHDFDPIAACDELVERWTDSPAIEHGKAQACYIPSLDKVEMPSPRTFFVDEHYYSALFHELVHSTGHHSRLNRFGKLPNHNFGSRDYSQEELIAEMGASYLSGLTGIEQATLDNSAAYIQGWLKRLKSDRKFFVQAATQAQRAVDYILKHQGTPACAAANSEKEATTVSFSF